MVELYPKGYGLAAIVGLNEEQVSVLVQKIHSVRTPVYVANINAPRQIVIAGSNEGMNKVLEAARKSGAHKAVRLDVSETLALSAAGTRGRCLEKEFAGNALATAEDGLCGQCDWKSIAKRRGYR